MPDLEVVAANLHNDRRPVDWLRARSKPKSPGHYDVAMTYEAQRRKRALSGLPGHTYLTGHLPGPSQETGVLLSKGLSNLGHQSMFLSPEAERFESVGKERWGQVVFSQIGDTKFGAISLHPVAGPKALGGNDANHPLVRRYAMAMRWLEATLDWLDTMNYEAIVGSDIQMMQSWDAMWSPLHIFRERKMRFFWERIDVIAVSNGFDLVSTTTHDIGSDHPALRAGVNVK